MDQALTVFDSLHRGLLDADDPEAYERAWGRFCEAYQPKIRAWAARMGLNSGQIDEIAGRVLVKLVRSLRGYRAEPGRTFSAWLRVVVRNEVKDFWSSDVRRPGGVGSGGSVALEALAQELDREADDATEFLVAELDAEFGRREALVRRAVEAVRGRVQPETWEAFSLTTFGELSGKEVAERLGRSVASVHMARSRVSGILREELARLGLEA